jgi:glycosyltransferase involved in cell wall biosynthesis
MENRYKLNRNKPRVSIGMPVFNGEKYIKEAIDSLLAQTYQDFELIISDNASTDQTRQICREYATKDNRIHYYRNEKNLGVPRNFNRVFELSKGELFKWAAHDDVHATEYLRKCVSVLDEDPSVILCHSKTGRIDEHGLLEGNYDHRTLQRVGSWKLSERFGDLISIRNPCWAILGVARASSLRKTPLLGSYIGADRNLLAEIGLMGRIFEIPEHLFFRRDHPGAYTRQFCEAKFAVNFDNLAQQLAWWSQEDWTNLPNWKDCIEFFRSVNRVPLGLFERLACYDQIFRWFIEEGWFFMGGDIENLLTRRSQFARKLFPSLMLNLGRTVIPMVRKMRK